MVDSRSSSSSTPGSGSWRTGGRRTPGASAGPVPALTSAPTVTSSSGSGGTTQLGPPVTDELLHRPHRQALLDDALDQLFLQRPVRGPEQGPGVTGRDGPFRQGPLCPCRELEQAQGVGHRGPTLAHPSRHLLVGQSELIDQLLIGGGFLEGIEVNPVQVLDQGLLETGDVIGHLDQDRDGLQTGPPGRPPTPLPRDELVRLGLVRSWRTRTGCSRPTALIEAASEAIDSSSKWLLGW